MKQETKDSLDRYAKEGCPTGDFLRAVLANDLMESFGRADIDNREDMFDICSYVYNDTPAACHGSYDKVDKWIEYWGERRKAAADEG